MRLQELLSLRFFSGFVLFVILLVFMFSRACAETHGWPIEPPNVDHAIANTLGEYEINQVDVFVVNGTVVAAKAYQHEGIDILAEPGPSPTAPYVVVTVPGTVDRVEFTDFGRDNYVRIVSADTEHYYYYHHLEYMSLSWALEETANETPEFDAESYRARINTPSNWPKMNAGDRIAQVYDAFACDYDHLHYQIERRVNGSVVSLINPLADLDPKPDPDTPEILDVFFAKADADRWSEIPRNATPQACTTVSGKLDIIAEVGDRDDAGSTLAAARNVGVYELAWRACPQGDPDCNWSKSHKFGEMPPEWTNPSSGSVKTQFSETSPWKTTPEPWLHQSQACPVESGNQTFMIATGISGSWNTTSGEYPNGKYEVSVKAKDLAGNEKIYPVPVCVDN